MTAAGEIPNDRNPKFPVGMRVLAVDDDPTCLKLLDTLLSKCQYHVTTTGQAVTALKMLRENKNMFDLVISDVCMPDMNGFKLLELVGLEMDLPVIMLSAHGDTEHVMKGISHGACDYLLKPVRIEELRNIWQHVIRRKKIDIKDQKSFDQTQDDNVEDFTKAAEVYQNDKISRKRKDKNGDEYEEHDQDGDHNEDPSWQKKPRLVWTPELHRLFVAAVNQLGIDKAVPKRILETMNVENVTRENVASHLQKYRVSLKRMSEEASHQANMASVLRRADSSYLRGGSVNGFGDLHSSGMSGQIQNSAFGSFPQGGVLGRLNSPGLCILGLSSSGIQRDRPQTNLTTLGTGVSNLQSRVQHENQNGNILQGVPLSLGLDQLQLNQNNSHIGELSVCSNESNIYANSNVFPNSKTVVGSSIKSFSDVQNNPVAVENHLQSTQKDVVPGNHYSVLSNTLNSECSQSLDYKRFDDTWLDANKSSMNLPNTCTSDYFNQSAQRNVRLIPTVPVQMGTIAHARLSDQRSELQRQVALVSSSASQNMNLTQKRHSGNWDGYKSPMSNMINSSIDSSISPQYDTGLMGQRLDSGSMGSYQKHDGSLAGQSNLLDPMLLQHNKVEQPAAQATTELNYGSLMGQWNPNSSYAHSKADSLEDLVAVMMKEEEWMLNTNGGGEFGIGCINTEDLERSLVLVPLPLH